VIDEADRRRELTAAQAFGAVVAVLVAGGLGAAWFVWFEGIDERAAAQTREEMRRGVAEMGEEFRRAADEDARAFADAVAAAQEQTYTITRAMDGDTFEIDNGLATVRLAVVDTPEVWEKRAGEWQRIESPDPRGVAASEWMSGLVGRRVRLEIVARDAYGRLLVEAELLDGTDLAAEIRRRGWHGPAEREPDAGD
jgi:endonuclease YncB( thermonuclease family)